MAPAPVSPMMIRRAAACAGLALALAAVIAAHPREITHAAAAPRRDEPPKKSKPAEDATAPTWSHDVAPVLYRNCTACHHPGGAGPFSLLTYDDAKRWAPQVLTVTQSRYMPPWLPEPGYGDFADARRLSDHDLALIKRWVAAGTPAGDARDAPAAPRYSKTWTLGTPDLVLTVAQPYVVPAGGQDVFRNFVLPTGLKQTRYVRAMEILPGAPAVVHHANVLIDRTAQYRREHPHDWQQGVPGMDLVLDAGDTFDPDGHFLFWKPDTPALVEPAGMPWRLDPGNDLILNMHLKPTGKQEVVSAQIGLYFADAPPERQPMLLQLDRDDGLKIPAGQADFTVEDELTLPVDVSLLGIYPHAHYLGKEMESWATLPDGSRRWLIRIRDWDIDRQSIYPYREPPMLPKGTVLHMRFTYDNSAANPHNPHTPPVEVKAGNRSEDEMAHLWLQVLPKQARTSDGKDTRLLLEEAWMRDRLKRTPDDYVSLYNLATALADEGKTEEATQTFRRILEAKPDDARTMNAMASVVASSGDWQKARALYTSALEKNDGLCEAWFNLASLDLKHDLAADAEGSFRAFLTHCPEDAEVRHGLGAALLAEGQLASAKTEFERTLTLDPSAALASDSHESLAFVAMQGGRVDEALEHLHAAAKLSPKDPGPHTLQADILAQSGRLADAIAEQRRALALDPNSADGWNNLGVYEIRSGQTENARQDFEHALRLDPGNQQARENLGRLAGSH